MAREAWCAGIYGVAKSRTRLSDETEQSRFLCNIALTASDLASITSHIHNWVLCLLWLHLFILSGVISPLISVAYWAPTDLGSSSFSILSFCLFILFMGFSRQESESGSFPMSRLFASGDQSIAASASASVLPVNIQGWFPLGLTGLISLLCKVLSRIFSSTRV